MSAAPLTAAELGVWRRLIGAAHVALQRPSATADREFRRAAEAGYSTPVPAPGDPVGMRLYFRIVEDGKVWFGLPDADRARRFAPLRAAIDACGEALGPATPTPTARTPWWKDGDMA